MRHALLLIPLVVACFGSHGTDCDDCRRDTGVPDAMSLDAGPPLLICHCCGFEVETTPDLPCELGVCDPFCLVPPPDCDPTPIDLICGYSHVTAGTPTDLPVQIGGRCFCGESVSCRATITGRRSLEFSTGLCSDDPFCDGCFPFAEGTCEVPPLDEGQWTVHVNGQPAFHLNVAPADIIVERGFVCQTSAYRDDSCGVEWPPRAYEPSGFCHPAGAYAGQRVAIEVTDGCGGCGVGSGTCRVDVFDDIIRVTPTGLSSACDVDCPAVCVDRQDTCITPPLEPGVWRLVVGDEESSITVSDGDEPPPTGEVCGLHMPFP